MKQIQKPAIFLSLRNTAPRGEIFYSLVMRYKKQECLFPIGSLESARDAYLSASTDVEVLKSFWNDALKPVTQEEGVAS